MDTSASRATAANYRHDCMTVLIWPVQYMDEVHSQPAVSGGPSPSPLAGKTQCKQYDCLLLAAIGASGRSVVDQTSALDNAMCIFQAVIAAVLMVNNGEFVDICTQE